MKTARYLGAIILALVLVSQAPASAVTYTRVTVATTATLVWTSPYNTPTGRVLVRNPSAVSVYLGDASVTTANGFELAAGDAIALNLDANDKLYGIVASATQVVHVIQGSAPQ